MRLTVSRTICLIACLAIALPMFALQRGNDPLTGKWSGDWGPSPADRNQVSVDLKWDGKALTGVVHPDRGGDVNLQKATFDASSGAVHMETDVPNPFRQGQMVHYVIDGKLANGAMTGSWNHDNRKGDFKLTRK